VSPGWMETNDVLRWQECPGRPLPPLHPRLPDQTHEAEARANRFVAGVVGPWSSLESFAAALLGAARSWLCQGTISCHRHPRDISFRSRSDGLFVQVRAMGSGDRWVVKFKEATPPDKVADVCVSMQKAPEIVAMGQGGSSGGHCHTQAQVQATQFPTCTTPMSHHWIAIIPSY